MGFSIPPIKSTAGGGEPIRTGTVVRSPSGLKYNYFIFRLGSNPYHPQVIWRQVVNKADSFGTSSTLLFKSLITLKTKM